jgi:hypothetical protein
VGLRSYTGPGYSAVNESLRGIRPMTPEIQSQVDGAVRALEALPDHVGTVYRGETLHPGDRWLDDYQPGNVVPRDAFTSSSVDNPFQGNVQYTIKSHHGRSVGEVSYFPSETEVLFKPGTRFEILDRQTIDGVIRIVMREK